MVNKFQIMILLWARFLSACVQFFCNYCYNYKHIITFFFSFGFQHYYSTYNQPFLCEWFSLTIGKKSIEWLLSDKKRNIQMIFKIIRKKNVKTLVIKNFWRYITNTSIIMREKIEIYKQNSRNCANIMHSSIYLKN